MGDCDCCFPTEFKISGEHFAMEFTLKVDHNVLNYQLVTFVPLTTDCVSFIIFDLSSPMFLLQTVSSLTCVDSSSRDSTEQTHHTCRHYPHIEVRALQGRRYAEVERLWLQIKKNPRFVFFGSLRVLNDHNFDEAKGPAVVANAMDPRAGHGKANLGKVKQWTLSGAHSWARSRSENR